MEVKLTSPQTRQVFHAGSRKLDKEFGNILAPKKWPTLSEPNLIVSAAAWEWLRRYSSAKLSRSGVALQELVIEHHTGNCLNVQFQKLLSFGHHF